MAPPLAAGDFKWDDDAVALLRKLWADRYSGSQCVAEFARQLGRAPTRSAILGKVHRLKLGSHSVLTVSPRRRKPKLGGGGPKRRFVASPPIVADDEEPLDVEPVLPAEGIQLAQRRQLLELAAEQCRFPYGDVGTTGFFFCGAQASGSYCACHTRIAHGRAPRISEAERLRRSMNGRRQAEIYNKRRRASR